MQEIKVPMVVTHEGDNGRMRARPMAAHLDPHANAIFFLTDAEATRDKEIYRNDNVCLVFSDIRKQHYVSLTGRAELSDDRAKIKLLWSSIDSAFWSDEERSIRYGCSKSCRQLPNTGTAEARSRALSKWSKRRSREASPICVRTKKWSCPEHKAKVSTRAWDGRELHKLSAIRKRLYDRAGNGRSATSIGQRHVMRPTQRARKVCAERRWADHSTR